jgi:hypothetical protein
MTIGDRNVQIWEFPVLKANLAGHPENVFTQKG